MREVSHGRHHHFSASLAVILVVLGGMIGVDAVTAAVPLAHEGQTDYRIVRPSDPGSVDDYAVQELRVYLGQITGAEFDVISPTAVAAEGRYLFVGMSEPVRARIGDDPLAELEPQEHVARNEGEDIFLYGKGVHGNLDAVMLFLRESLGWRWYTRFEHPVVPDKPTVELEPFHHTLAYNYTHRRIHMHRGMDWPLQMGINQGFDPRVWDLVNRPNAPKERADRLAHFVSYTPDRVAGFHTLHAYLPPSPKFSHADKFEVIEQKNYFEAHPEWYSYDAAANERRWNKKQVCFSIPEMRAELTSNIRKVADQLPEGSILALGAEDSPGAFCDCPGCQALEAEYATTAGPILDYAFDLCDVLARTHPTMKVRTVAYRRDQTQRPPKLPEGKKLPDNLIIWFAPIHDNYFADWTHPDEEIQRTYADLVRWGELASELHMYMYPNPYGSGTYLPVGNVRRFVNDLRMAHEAGATGAFIDHAGAHQRAGFSELQTYLYVNLMRDIDQDAEALIVEFTDHMYGVAGELMRRYMGELEEGRRAMIDLPDRVTYRSYDRDLETFPYLTVENIHRWQGYFDQMTDQVASAPERVQVNVDLARRELDFATLWRWYDLQDAYPGYYTDHTVVADRIEQANEAKWSLPRTDDSNRTQNRTAWEIETGKTMNRRMKPLTPHVVRDLVVRIEAGGEEKPLPARFADIDPERIRTFVPEYPNNRPGRKVIPDPDSPFGFAIPVENPDLPFQFGFYQGDTRTHGARRRVELSEIEPGVYQTFRLGNVEVTPECSIWFSADSWATRLQVGDRLYEPGEDTHWDAYVTVKFDGPTYGSEPNEELLSLEDRQAYERRRDKTEDLVLVGRIIMVKSSPNGAD